jgi:hypothetical protein
MLSAVAVEEMISSDDLDELPNATLPKIGRSGSIYRT